jgi:ribulose-phosphate 3-epimerase
LHPELIISVDGGVNLDTAKILVEAGADRLVVGSALFKTDNVIETLEAFESL